MKKLLLLTITLALAVMCLIAGRGTAYADVLDGDSNTVLLAPSSVCSDGDILAVADNVDGGTILHLFSSDGLKSLNVSGETQKSVFRAEKFICFKRIKSSSAPPTTDNARTLSFRRECATSTWTENVFIFGSGRETWTEFISKSLTT